MTDTDSTPTFSRFNGESLLSRALAVITAAILLKTGFAFRHLITPLGNTIATTLLFATYLTAFLLILTAVLDIDFDRWGRVLSTVVFAVVIALASVAYLTKTGNTYLGTDAMLFSRYSVDLILNGKNPYAHSMEPAFNLYTIGDQYVTYKRDASIVTSLSYPSLSVLVFLPQALLGIPNLNLTTVVVFLLTVLFLWWETPRKYAFAPIVVMFTDPSLILFSFGGVFDIIWVLPMLVMMKFWYSGRLRLAAICAGLAFAVKQTPWFIGPFLAIWLYAASKHYGDFLQKARTCIGYGLAAFLAPNLPFIVMDPDAWMSSVLTPIAGGGTALVKQGLGATMLTVANIYPVPKSVYTLLMLGALLLLTVTYLLFFDRMQDALWFAPMIVLWFNYRSLQNYFVYFIPIAYYAVLLRIRADGLHFGNTGMKPLDTSALPNLSARLPTRTRVLTVLAITAFVAVSVTGSAIALHETASADLNVEIQSYSDPHDVGAYTLFTVSVTNNHNKPIEPVFNVVHSGHQTHTYWNIESGPKTLAPGETGTYVLTSPASQLSITYGSELVLGVNDRGTELGKRIGPITTPEKPMTTPLNPEFGDWVLPYGHENTQPYRWARTTHTVEATEHASIQPANNGQGITMTAGNVTRKNGGWTMAGVTQTTAFPKTVTVNATPHVVTDTPVRHPPVAAGVELIDRNHRIWILFADVEQQKVRYRSSGDLSYTLVYVPATPGEQTTATVNVTEIYEERGWRYPAPEKTSVAGMTQVQRPVTIHPFVAAYPGTTRSEVSLTLHSVTMTRNWPQNETAD